MIEAVDVVVQQNPGKGPLHWEYCTPALRCMSLEVENLEDLRGARH